jgi:hypothetical protein
LNVVLKQRGLKKRALLAMRGMTKPGFEILRGFRCFKTAKLAYGMAQATDELGEVAQLPLF